jgi:predicted  nucleic acid-binding Zn-ribbon protein
MPPQTVERRLDSLEGRVTKLEELPARLDDLTSRVLQMRTEMRDEFSALRQEISGVEGVIATLGEAIEAARREARVLFEEVISRIAALGEGRAAKKRTKKRLKER